MIQRQTDDRADRSDPCAINRVHVETVRPATAEQREHPAADERTKGAKQHIDNGALARGADCLAYGQPEHAPQ